MQRQQKLLEDSYNAQRGQQPGQQGMGEGEMSQGQSGKACRAIRAAARAAGQVLLGRNSCAATSATSCASSATRLAICPMVWARPSNRCAVPSTISTGQDFGSAAENQNNALSQLQQGLQSAQQMMQRQAGQVPGRGQRDKMDPLGRPTDEDSEGSAVDSSSIGIPDERARWNAPARSSTSCASAATIPAAPSPSATISIGC